MLPGGVLTVSKDTRRNSAGRCWCRHHSKIVTSLSVAKQPRERVWVAIFRRARRMCRLSDLEGAQSEATRTGYRGIDF